MSDTPYQYIDATGIIIPDTSDILTTVQNETLTAFGADTIVTPDTPQGVLITAEVLARDNVVRNNAAVANQINPRESGGVFLDAVCALTGLEREGATSTTVTGTLAGVDGTVIPAGSRAQTIAGDIFVSTAPGIISGGTVDVPFQAEDSGPIGCLAANLTQIVDGILGWESITNSANGIVGVDVQSDQSLRLLRKNTLAGQGVSLVEAQVSNLYLTPGVKSVTFRENVADSTQTIDGITMVANSVYACVDGGADLDVATSLLENKSGGSPWNGGTSVDVLEPASGQTYTVLFDRPTLEPIAVAVTIKNTAALSDPVTAIKSALIDFVNGVQGDNLGWTVGTSVSTFELAAGINFEVPGVYIQLLQTKKISGGSFASTEIAITINQKATLQPSDISVTLI